jgi:gas vesicle protein
MMKKNQESEYRQSNNILAVLISLLLGGLAGALTMLLMAPQSGEKTRKQIQKRSIELRNQTTGMVNDVLAQVTSDAKKITKDGRHKAKELMQQGQALVVEQLDHVSEAAKAGKKAIQSY